MHKPLPAHVELGQVMRAVRDHLGRPQATIARHMGCTRQHLGSFENGRGLPVPDTWEQWLAAVEEIAQSKPRDSEWHAVLQAKLTAARDLFVQAQAQTAARRQEPASTAQRGNLGEADIDVRSMSLLDDGGLGALEVGLVPTRREMLGYLGTGLMAAGLEQTSSVLPEGFPRVLHALQVTRPDAQSFTALVEHYKRTLRTTPSASLYGELLGVRAHAGSLLEGRSARGRSRELTVAAGWLSNLLALVTYDLGDHAAALVWCTDATRRSQDAGHPELAVWAEEIRVLMAYYTGQARQAVAHAQHGQTLAPAGTVGHAKLVAQEMRAWALLGDARMVASARHRAEQAIAKLPATVSTRGAFSIRLAEDPPYTATSLLLLGHFQEAEVVTRRVIATFYGSDSGTPSTRPAKFAHTYLVLALALAGRGKLEEAAAAGSLALDAPQLMWPVAVLAGRLDQTLQRDFEDTTQARDYHQRYATAIRQHRPSAPPVRGGTARGGTWS